MLGRFARNDVLASVGLMKVLQVAVAGGLVAGAAAAQYLFHAPPAVVIGLSVGSLAFTGFPIIWEAACGLAHFESNVDELVSLAILASMILGEWVSAAIVALIMVLGSLIEQFTSQRARRHIESLVSATPSEALLVADDGRIVSVPAATLEPGQRILARPGDVIAADGLVEEGESEVDESMLTGESVPAAKSAGDSVAAGGINGHGSLRIRVQRVGQESTHGKIIRLVHEAEQHRAPILRAAERYARWFTPTVLVLAGTVWAATGDPHRAVTMLIVGCPCAFVLATPTAVIAALGRASKRGILVKGGKYLEACANVDLVALDKTGTLTTGRCAIREVIPMDGVTADELLFHAARLEAGAEHPLARAIVQRARDAGIEVPEAAAIRRESGLGISELDPRPWHIGNQRFIQRQNVVIDDRAAAYADSARANGYTVLFLSEGPRLRGLLAVDDEVRPEAPRTLAELRAAGYRDIYVLTGDARHVAQHVGRALDIPPERILAELLPDEKYRHLELLGREGRRVCYIGDGTNDGPALALASVGVSIGSRENTVALETADAILMRDGLAGLPFLLRLGKQTTRTINQNLLVFGLVLNATMLALSAAGILTPIVGAIGHNLGSVAVVLNSARLLRWKG